jgi:protein-S-isoprenylcysteine O-methyltransferase Ste14
MAPESMVLLIGLVIFWGVSLQNVLATREKSATSQTSSPMSIGFILALLGSLGMFAEALALIALEITGSIDIGLGAVQGLGLTLFFAGCLLHAWSVAVRGRCAVSWSMSEEQRLITDGPYAFVRHPSYLGYMLMVIGVTAVWQMWFTYIPWVAIPGYYLVSKREDALLLEHFGYRYGRYMEKVGAFIPKF